MAVLTSTEPKPFSRSGRTRVIFAPGLVPVGPVGPVVHRNLRAAIQHRANTAAIGLAVRPAVGEHRHVEVAHQASRHVVRGAQRIANTECGVSSPRLNHPGQAHRLGRDVRDKE